MVPSDPRGSAVTVPWVAWSPPGALHRPPWFSESCVLPSNAVLLAPGLGLALGMLLPRAPFLGKALSLKAVTLFLSVSYCTISFLGSTRWGNFWAT